MKTNTIAVIVSVVLIIYLLFVIRRENMEGEESKAVKYVRDAGPKKFINPYIVYGFAKEQTDDEKKLARIIPLAKSGDRQKLLAYLRQL